MKDKMDERRKSEKWWKKKGATKKPTEKQRKMSHPGAPFFVRKKWRAKGSTRNFTKSFQVKNDYFAHKWLKKNREQKKKE